MKAFVVGGTGYIGSHLCEELLRLGHEVVSTGCNSPKIEPHEHLDVTKGNVTVPKGTDIVYYLAQAEEYHRFPGSAQDLFAVNSMGPLKVATAALDANCSVFLYASTGSVYAPSFLPLTEDAPVNRKSAYALSKIHAEQILNLFSEYMAVCCFRPFGIYGPGQAQKLAANLLRAIHRKQKITLEPGPKEKNNALEDIGGLRLSWLYIGDIVNQLVTLGNLALTGTRLPSSINLAGPGALSIREISTAMAQSLGVEPEFKKGDKIRTTDLIADIQLASSLLNPEFTPITKGIEQCTNSASL